ncbi:MAG: OsmC family protein [Brachybacterium tyrofermentans]
MVQPSSPNPATNPATPPAPTPTPAPAQSPPRGPPDPAGLLAPLGNGGGTNGQVRVHDGPAALAAEDPAAARPDSGRPAAEVPARTPSAPEVSLPTGGPTTPARGFNPEQFLAMAWSTCLGETLRVVLSEHGLPHDSHVSVEVGLHRDPSGGYLFAPRALVTIDAMAADEAQPLLEAAHARCPVSKLLRGPDEPVVELHESADAGESAQG